MAKHSPAIDVYLTPHFTATNFIVMGVSFPMGDALTAYATNSTMGAFREVTVVRSKSAADDAFVCLTPSIQKFLHTQGGGTIVNAKLDLLLLVKWEVTSRGRNLGSFEVTAESQVMAGNSFNYIAQNRKAVLKLLDDLQLRTFSAFQQSDFLNQLPTK